MECPYCESEDHDSTDIDVDHDDDTVTVSYCCDDCGEYWSNEYTLSSIRLNDGKIIKIEPTV